MHESPNWGCTKRPIFPPKSFELVANKKVSKSGLPDSRSRYSKSGSGGGRWICAFGEQAEMSKGAIVYDSLKIHKIIL